MKKAEKNNFPHHIAIIMDGNGRWARKRRLPRIMGHRAGIKTAEKIVRACVNSKIKILTLYTFSTDNWKRPKREIVFLFNLLKDFLKKESKKILEYNIRFQVIGRINELPKPIQEELFKLIEASKSNGGLILNLALNYAGRIEIVDAVRKIADALAKGDVKKEEIDEGLFSQYLYTAGLLDPDLLIRTGGECRVSNFLLWQLSYTEIYISKKFWPDFTSGDLNKAIAWFGRRERRFGGIPTR